MLAKSVKLSRADTLRAPAMPKLKFGFDDFWEKDMRAEAQGSQRRQVET